MIYDPMLQVIQEKWTEDGYDFLMRLRPPGSTVCEKHLVLKPEYDKPENYVEHVWYEDPFLTGDKVEHRTRIIKSTVPEEWTEEVYSAFPWWFGEGRVVGADGFDRAMNLIIEDAKSEEEAKKIFLIALRKEMEVLKNGNTQG